ncbi:Hsp70 family protein [Prochlorothrix hollandica]|uniref:Hsp70 family protein n=1 Tax=Prochlorothrix hollandica TaxID=1223 RepID=UPI00034D3A0F|nr:Hsp70 family protein [Prochlorothrix hollandica]
MAQAIGIDLGTTNSVVAALDGGEPWVITDEDGNELLPSCVGLDANGKLLVGTDAWNQYAAAPDRTVRSIKRQMGTNHLTTLGDQTYRPQEISAIILRNLKERAEALLEEPVTQAVITVPAYFTDAQRQATKEAGEIAGLEVLQIINEPTAAALTYESPDEDVTERVLVYDLGGGTFDVSIVDITGDVTEVIASHGNNRLGGDDFDRRLQLHLNQCFQDSNGTPVPPDPTVEARLLRAAEQAKINLSSHSYVTVREGFLGSQGAKPLHLEVEITRDTFETLIEPLLEETLEAIDRALKDAEMKAEELDRVILVGGSTRIPLVRRLVTEHLGQEASSSVQPDLCVALGAAIQAGVLSGEEVSAILVDITPHSLGLATVVETPFGLVPNRFSVIIPRNTPIPVSQSDVFATVRDNQKNVEIEVFQGENAIANENVPLGNFRLVDLPLLPAGEVTLEVTFDFDLNGILTVTAIEKSQGQQNSIEVSGLDTSRLSSHDIKQAQSNLDLLFNNQEALLAAELEGMEAELEAELGEDEEDSADLDPDTEALTVDAPDPAAS